MITIPSYLNSSIEEKPSRLHAYLGPASASFAKRLTVAKCGSTRREVEALFGKDQVQMVTGYTVRGGGSS
jgi:hypothetical protein